MKFIRTDETGKVIFQHNFPFDQVIGLGKTEEELRLEGFIIDSIPEPEQIDGKTVVTYYSDEDGFVFVYNEIPKTQEQIQAEKLDQLENQTAEYMVDLDFRLSNIELGL